jgi:hypothetical protein
MRVGDRQVTTNLDRQWVKFVSGLQGLIPDGVLVRVSTRTVSDDAENQFQLHDRFVADLMKSIDAKTVALLVGRGAPGRRSPQGS